MSCTTERGNPLFAVTHVTSKATDLCAIHRVHDKLGCVFQDMEPPKLSSILRKSSGMQEPIQRVKLTKVVARHAKIRDQSPSLEMICPGDPHQRKPNGPKFENRSQEETEWQERCAREAAWRLAKNIHKNLKAKLKTAFFSPSERCVYLRHQPLNQRKENLL